MTLLESRSICPPHPTTSVAPKPGGLRVDAHPTPTPVVSAEGSR